MQAKELALQNFAIAAHLLDLHQLLTGFKTFDPGKDFELALCSKMEMTPGTAFHHTRSERALCSVKASIPLPSCLLADGGMDFLLRQAILVSAAALESFVWDVLRENALTVIKAKGRKTNDTIRNITLTLDDYLSLEDYEDPDIRLQQIILKRFERGALYDLDKVTEIATKLGVKDFWKEISRRIGTSQEDLKQKLPSLITRRNQIAHRADRPDDEASAENIDRYGLRVIFFPWTNTHVQLARSFITASAEVFEQSVDQMKLIIARKEEQKLAQETLRNVSGPA
ncbi:MAG: hypothetical protein IT186_21610 [Acidobacteria bacterium]|nr:hypothetical protein [Acidobacteriota bacterium]